MHASCLVYFPLSPIPSPLYTWWGKIQAGEVLLAGERRGLVTSPATADWTANIPPQDHTFYPQTALFSPDPLVAPLSYRGSSKPVISTVVPLHSSGAWLTCSLHLCSPRAPTHRLCHVPVIPEYQLTLSTHSPPCCLCPLFPEGWYSLYYLIVNGLALTVWAWAR